MKENQKKATGIFSWLGFGISLAVLVLIWIINTSLLNGDGGEPVRSVVLYFISILTGSILGGLGLTFSIVGLVIAVKRSYQKWQSICGIIFFCLSVLSLLVFFVATTLMEADRIHVNNPDYDYASVTTGVDAPRESSVTTITEKATVNPFTEKRTVVLEFDRYSDVKCYEQGSSAKQAKMDASFKGSFLNDLKTWLKVNNINKTSRFIIIQKKDTEYRYIVNIVEALEQLGVKNFTIQ